MHVILITFFKISRHIFLIASPGKYSGRCCLYFVARTALHFRPVAARTVPLLTHPFLDMLTIVSNIFSSFFIEAKNILMLTFCCKFLSVLIYRIVIFSRIVLKVLYVTFEVAIFKPKLTVPIKSALSEHQFANKLISAVSQRSEKRRCKKRRFEKQTCYEVFQNLTG